MSISVKMLEIKLKPHEAMRLLGVGSKVYIDLLEERKLRFVKSRKYDTEPLVGTHCFLSMFESVLATEITMSTIGSLLCSSQIHENFIKFLYETVEISEISEFEISSFIFNVTFAQVDSYRTATSKELLDCQKIGSTLARKFKRMIVRLEKVLIVKFYGTHILQKSLPPLLNKC